MILLPLWSCWIDPDDLYPDSGPEGKGTRPDSESDADTDTDSDTDTDADSDEEPNIDTEPSSLDFGLVDIGTTAIRSILVRNDGDGDLLVSEVRFTNSVYSDGGGTLLVPQVISPGMNKVLNVNFSPVAVGEVRGDLILVSDDPDAAELGTTLKGEGQDGCSICAPILEVDTGENDDHTLDFALVSAIEMSGTTTLKLSNVGDQALTISDAVVTNDFLATCGTFSVSGRRTLTLQPQDSSTLDVTWSVSGSCLEIEQSSQGMNILEITSNDPSSPYVIKLGGVAI